MLNFIKEKISKLYTSFTTAIGSLFSRSTIDDTFFDELKVVLLQADTGVACADHLITQLKTDVASKRIDNPQALKMQFSSHLEDILNELPTPDREPKVVLMVGINGSGKTTFCAKYAHQLAQRGKKVLLIAADTFRAAASEQLESWGAKINVTVLRGTAGQDPASLVFDGCKTFIEEQYDHLIIDTAGRLQTKTNLMKELEKIRRIIGKHLPDVSIATWLTIDAMLGQNSFDQARIFNEATDLSSIVLTKLDGTGKGGIIFAIACELQLPISFITFGEQLEDLREFQAAPFVKELIN